ncbi:DUF2254 domain-containing protein [Thioalkalivibrio sp. XN279]|uniref:DUF2254 domain-containing protein n=1 Tax=Thioalkalivibrio sp. XN279 TaxID=2714953 RepID=UPI00140DD052|nr:DUF2254 domain-containing protein [Thioalkalivibrio sp. XN279]NHA15779.1 DUF2254 domain-containing protein [Thioalkalivibrio sp. XN279]
MRVRVFTIFNRIRSSFWFLPAAMATGAMVLAFATVALDTAATDWLALNWGLTFTGGAEGGAALLGTIAGSMITIAGVVFSMTLVALSLASSQLGPRLLRNFMRDTMTQVVLGTFVATFLYCLLVLRTIRRAEETLFVPHLSVSLGVLLAVVSVGVLIYFIHHVSVSIQANEIVARVGKELIEGIERLFPEKIGRGAPRTPKAPPDADFLDRFGAEACPIGSAADGYLQFVDGDDLMALAMQEDVVIRVEPRPGHYVVATRPLVHVWPGNRVNDQLIERVHSAFALGNQRTSGQDIEFGVNELVEIAIRALSPGVNDPFTAMTCVDRLGSALCRLAERDMPSPYRYDTEDQLRLITHVFTFADVTDAAFNQIRQYGRSSTAVTIRLLETITEIAGSVHRQEDRLALLRHATMIARGAVDGLPEEKDRQEVEKRFQSAQRLLTSSPARLRIPE